MTANETVKVLKFLSGCYPAERMNWAAKDMEEILQAWAQVFDREELFPVERVMEAAKRHVMGARGRFFPTPRDIIEQLPPFEDGKPSAAVKREEKR